MKSHATLAPSCLAAPLAGRFLPEAQSELAALGSKVQIIASFPKAKVRIKQFDDRPRPAKQIRELQLVLSLERSYTSGSQLAMKGKSLYKINTPTAGWLGIRRRHIHSDCPLLVGEPNA